MKLALKVDVDTLLGTLAGVPTLLDVFQRHGIVGTFLFSVGPDHTGRALRRLFRPGFLTKVRRTSVLRHYGLRTCLYGTLLPGPDIGRRAGDIMRQARARGHEVGVHAYDHVLWQDTVANRSALWTLREMRAAHERFRDIFGFDPVVHGAAGWQMNPSAFVAEDALGFTHASDTRGSEAFLPRIGQRTLHCMQLPTTLPTLDELIGCEEFGDPVEHLLSLTARSRHDQVFTLHAELEGRALLAWFERLLAGWHAQGFELTSLWGLAASLNRAALPVREIGYGPIPGRSGSLALMRPVPP